MIQQRVIIADDHAVVRQGVRSLLESFDYYHVIAEACSVDDLSHKALSLQPNLLILDYRMPGGDVLAVAEYLKRQIRPLKVLIYTALSSPPILKKLSHSKIDGLVLKQDSFAQLIDSLESLRSGLRFISVGANEYIRRNEISLTAREVQVLEMISSGSSRLTIADTLKVSPETIKTHRKNLMRKLNVQSTTELINRARQLAVYETEIV